jgi:hypothetical protein
MANIKIDDLRSYDISEEESSNLSTDENLLIIGGIGIAFNTETGAVGYHDDRTQTCHP